MSVGLQALCSFIPTREMTARSSSTEARAPTLCFSTHQMEKMILLLLSIPLGSSEGFAIFYNGFRSWALRSEKSELRS